MQELVGHNAVCMFTSDMEKKPLQTRPMTTQQVDDQGNFWFFSARSSHKNNEIQQDSRVQLLFANTSASEFLTVYGRARVVEDRKKIEEIWSSLVKAWFPNGKEDPDLTLIRVTPENAYYWEPQSGKMVTLLKMAASSATGKTMEIGRAGSLNV